MSKLYDVRGVKKKKIKRGTYNKNGVSQSHRMTSSHKGLVEDDQSQGLQKHSGSGYQERLRGLREQDALLTQDTITLSLGQSLCH